jgi:hypothetical protein
MTASEMSYPAAASPCGVDYEAYDFDDLPKVAKKAANFLGFTRSIWDKDGKIPVESKDWDDLTAKQKKAATILGYTQAKWDDSDSDSSSLASMKKEAKSLEFITSTKVVVVGAGISGLACAYHLCKLSAEAQAQAKSGSKVVPRFDIEILEVRDRIGGRLHPVRIDGDNNNGEGEATTTNTNEGVWIDLGGQWVHETSPRNPIVRLLEDDLHLGFVGPEKGLSSKKTTNKFHKRRRKNVLFGTDGRILDKSIVQRARTISYKATEDYEASELPETAEVSLRDLLNARTQLELASDGRLTKPDSSLLQFKQALNYFVHRTEGFEGGKLDEISAFLAGNLYEGAGNGPDKVVEGSYKSLLEALASELRLNDEDIDVADASVPVRLRSNSRVERIEYGESKSKSKSNRSDEDKISLSVFEHDSSTNNDKRSVLECDYCVCTVPLGVLQQRKIDFVPPLPPERQAAIDGIGMGLLNKIVFRFDFDTTTTPTDENGKHSGNNHKFWGDLLQFGICHENPALVKTYYDCTDDYYDSEEETSSLSPAILVQFLAGSAADRIDPPRTEMDNDDNNSVSKGLTDEEAIEESLQALRSVFGKENVPDPSFSRVTRWREDPWSCGSYSFAKVGSTEGMYDEIASPLKRRLLFAGEHTSKRCHATVHGAWETGCREARRIFDEHRQQ